MITTQPDITILGVDPGYDRVGWAVGVVKLGQLLFLDFGCIQTSKTQERIERYAEIDMQLHAITQKYRPQEAAVETLFFSKNQKTAMFVSEARGVILSTLFRNKIEITEYNPVQIKQAVTGSGSADKKAMTKMVRLQFKGFPGFEVPALEKQIDDTLDALGMVITHATQRRVKKL